MTEITAQATVGQIVAERPALAAIFEKSGIDFCCGGKRTLQQVCAAKGIPVSALVETLLSANAELPADTTDWTNAPLSDLVDNIIVVHHDYLKAELPGLAEKVAKVHRAHGANHPELAFLVNVFTNFRGDMEGHLQKEEMILFPMIRSMENGNAAGQSHCGSVANPIHVMEMEHQGAGSALAEMRSLTDNFTPPADACNTFRVLLDGLEKLEANTHEHIHKEESILFPRAIAMEQAASH